MKSPLLPGISLFLSLIVSVAAVPPSPALGQEVNAAVRDAYFRALADHFEVSIGEVAIVGDWDLEPDEVPVVLFLSRRAGVSPDALIGLRRSGRPWRDVASGLGLGVGSFHLPMPGDAPLGSLERAYGEFRARPSRDWNQIELTDPEIIYLVNLRVLSEQVGVTPLWVLQCREEAGSFVAGFARLRTPARLR